MIENKRTTIKLSKNMLKKIKSIAVEEETTQNKVITDLIAKGLEASQNKGKIKAKVINQEMPYYDPDKKLNLNDLIGIAKVNNAENIDINELIDSIHYKKRLY